MAIQNRRGNYSDFDPEKMVPGEWATVLSGDPNAGDGKSIYHCFSAGDVKRMATYEDMEDNINKATDDIRNEFLEDINNATQSANTAATTANQAAQTAQKAAQDAQNAAESIEGAVEGTIINDQTPSNVTAFSGKYVDDTFLKKTGDATNTTVKFAPPDEEQDLVSGETSGTLFGKIVKKLSVIKAAIGTLSSLTTTNKSSLVGAVNELNSALAINVSATHNVPIPYGATAGDLYVDWDNVHRIYRIYGWFDIPTTTSADDNRKYTINLPPDFPKINSDTLLAMGTPCTVQNSIGVIYGSMKLNTNKTIDFYVPHINIVSVYLQPIFINIP